MKKRADRDSCKKTKPAMRQRSQSAAMLGGEHSVARETKHASRKQTSSPMVNANYHCCSGGAIARFGSQHHRVSRAS